MRAGRLRHRVTIQQRTSSGTNSFGNPTFTWSDLKTVWASVEPLDGTELLEGGAQLGESPVRVRMRHQSGITKRHRLQINSTAYNIESIVNPEERNIELEIMATKYEAGD